MGNESTESLGHCFARRVPFFDSLEEWRAAEEFSSLGQDIAHRFAKQNAPDRLAGTWLYVQLQAV